MMLLNLLGICGGMRTKNSIRQISKMIRGIFILYGNFFLLFGNLFYYYIVYF